MKKCVKLVREEHALSPTFHHRLNAYALAAGAAGVGLLAVAQPPPLKSSIPRRTRRLPKVTPFTSI